VAAAGAWDPVAALVLCGPHRARDLVVEGRRVIDGGRLLTADLLAATAAAARAVARLAG
jgi:hypothetical protein